MIAAPEDCSYGVSKSAVVYLTRQIAADYGKDSIICNAVAPGKILTGKGGRAVEPRWLDYSHARTPLPRLGRSEDVANAALFLASDEATLHHRREPDGRRRLDGELTVRAVAIGQPSSFASGMQLCRNCDCSPQPAGPTLCVYWPPGRAP